MWIVDGDSTDGTKDFLKTLNSPFKFISEKDDGIYEAMNKGVSRSKGNWLFFMGDDDCLFSNEVLQIIGEQLHDYLDILSGKIQYRTKDLDSQYIKKNHGVFISTWSNRLWIKNTVHHQSTFYNKSLFESNKFNTSYKVLADYDFNLKVFKSKPIIKTIDVFVSSCGTNGLSKKFTWRLYKEEIDLKTKASSIIFKPLFFVLGFFKYILK